MSTPAPDRLTPELRRALALAAEDARGRGHRHLGTGHLLMGVLGVPYARGAQVLARLRVSLHDVDAEIVRIAGYGPRDPDGEPGGTVAEDVFGRAGAPRRRWLRRPGPLPTSDAASAALRHASEAGGPAVGTEHLVLGLLAGPDGLACRILVARGVTLDHLRAVLTAG